jgi:citronellol/citronellal dehydrogenase
MARSRSPEIMADAAHALLTSPAAEVAGWTFIDEDVLRSRGTDDFGAYANTTDLQLDLFVDE